jgi:general secretion pathway protein B
MSYILDALRKSESDRNHGDNKLLHRKTNDASARLTESFWPLFIGVILLLGLVLAGIVYWRSPKFSDPVMPAEVAVQSSDETMTHTGTDQSIDSPLPDIQSVIPLKPRLYVDDLAEHVSVQAPLVDTSAANKSGKLITPVGISAASDNVAQKSAPDERLHRNALLLGQKSEAFQRSVPDLAVTIHVYSPAKSQRILFINNQEYHKGEEVEEGIRVVDIVEDGAVLSYRGELFKLSRPN